MIGFVCSTFHSRGLHWHLASSWYCKIWYTRAHLMTAEGSM